MITNEREGGYTFFRDNSSADHAAIHNYNSQLAFNQNSSAANANIENSTFFAFFDNSSAGSSQNYNMFLIDPSTGIGRAGFWALLELPLWKAQLLDRSPGSPELRPISVIKANLGATVIT